MHIHYEYGRIPVDPQAAATILEFNRNYGPPTHEDIAVYVFDYRVQRLRDSAGRFVKELHR